MIGKYRNQIEIREVKKIKSGEEHGGGKKNVKSYTKKMGTLPERQEWEEAKTR